MKYLIALLWLYFLGLFVANILFKIDAEKLPTLTVQHFYMMVSFSFIYILLFGLGEK